MSTLVLSTSIVLVGLGVYRADGEPEKRPEPPPATRTPSAVAYSLSGITIDGRLDDWPKDLPTYSIRNQLVKNKSYNAEERDSSKEPDAFFMTGYDREAEFIYLAAVVPDRNVIAKPGSVLGTDAVEIYVDGTFSNRTLNVPSEDWTQPLDAATMPVLQYVAIPGPVVAYENPWLANPSLLYSRTRHTATTMRYQRCRRCHDVRVGHQSLRPLSRPTDSPPFRQAARTRSCRR